MPRTPAADPLRPFAARLLLLVGLGVWMAACYFPAQSWPVRPATLVPPLPFEPTLSYHPAWVLVYQSIWPAHAAMIAALACTRTVRRYARDTAASYALAAPWFWLLPTTVGRPEEGDALYRALVLALDGPTNALPSLHAVMAVLVVCHLWSWSPRATRPLLLAWCALVFTATMATGQHRALDLIAGTLLALGVYGLGAQSAE